MIPSDKFCKAPFVSAVVDKDGSMLPCCEYLPHLTSRPLIHLKHAKRWWQSDMDYLRQSMAEGQVDAGCQHCISKESNPGQFSLRRWTNQRSPRQAQDLVESWQRKDLSQPTLLEIRLGNVCNLGCIMCSPGSSSTLAAEYHVNQSAYAAIDIHNRQPAIGKWWEDDELWQQMLGMVSRAKYLHFGGGEPFMHPRILELIESIPHDCQTSVNTNMTKFTERIYQALQQRPNLKLVASIEGTHEHNDYVRWPSRWAEIATAFDRLGNTSINVHHVLQHTSMFVLPRLLSWADDRRLPMTFGEIYRGSIDGTGMMTLDSVSPVDYQRFCQWLESYHGPYKALLANWAATYSFSQGLHQRFWRYTRTLDSIRGTDFDGVFAPSWALAQ